MRWQSTLPTPPTAHIETRSRPTLILRPLLLPISFIVCQTWPKTNHHPKPCLRQASSEIDRSLTPETTGSISCRQIIPSRQNFPVQGALTLRVSPRKLGVVGILHLGCCVHIFNWPMEDREESKSTWHSTPSKGSGLLRPGGEPAHHIHHWNAGVMGLGAVRQPRHRHRSDQDCYGD